jgi:hypothetical protein
LFLLIHGESGIEAITWEALIPRSTIQTKGNVMKRLLLLLWLGTTPCTHGGFVLLGEYKFDGGSPVVTTHFANTMFSDMTRVGVNYISGADTFNSSGWSTGNSIDPAKYVEFSIKAAPEFTLDKIVFESGRSSNGPNNAEAHVFNTAAPSQNATPIATFSYQPPVLSAGVTMEKYTFDSFAFTTTDGGTATFRFYGYAAITGGGTMRFDNVQVFGQITPVPEPIEWALGIFGGIFLTAKGIQVWRKRRQPSPVVANAG